MKKNPNYWNGEIYFVFFKLLQNVRLTIWFPLCDIESHAILLYASGLLTSSWSKEIKRGPSEKMKDLTQDCMVKGENPVTITRDFQANTHCYECPRMIFINVRVQITKSVYPSFAHCVGTLIVFLRVKFVLQSSF